ncbi:MAG: type II toxin-antitoxin system RelE/ParE family toxin [Candidatus Brocadia sp. WS118]|nr:MAG: type II toxin-antitoxin system RelE/ParE family toxin [Candidatus Brocadia sp. WS118]
MAFFNLYTMLEIKYSGKASKQFARIYKGDRKSAEMIIKAVEGFSRNPFGNFDIKILKGEHAKFKRLRIGDYRIIFEDDKVNMWIYEIKHRQEAY